MFEVFDKKNLGSIRVDINARTKTPWFVAADVCKILGIKNTSKACSELLEDEKITITLSDNGHKHPQLLVSESGLYILILRSRKKEAKDFQRWVTRELLPVFRGYMTFEGSLLSVEECYLVPQYEDAWRNFMGDLMDSWEDFKSWDEFINAVPAGFITQ